LILSKCKRRDIRIGRFDLFNGYKGFVKYADGKYADGKYADGKYADGKYLPSLSTNPKPCTMYPVP
jgi:type IV secretory pathway VirB4 component